MDSDKIDAIHRGGCVCGAIILRTTGQPLRVGLCHCLDCRKAHAAAFAAFVVFPPESVSITDADGSELTAGTLGVYDNGRGYRRHFCRSCGSRIYGTDDVSAALELHLGLFDETNLWAPTYEIWIKRREGWLKELDSIANRYEEDAAREGLSIG
ncbi:GFA family protein [Starkeya sp. ORNL1]|uniref:GFA family protein n=1 Tax=Starkeya sp. ORNL1 TaxID=2709380 RepID=UPI00146478F8|nr:GFA family protein [Starkeya sp. ORNL1]QJP12602.1 GFA family protein [Starkeya sp. ORNL1]